MSEQNVPPARPPTQLFDWKVECPQDVARAFPPYTGSGRGRQLPVDAAKDAHRKLRNRDLTGGKPSG